jgi:hypothetical protein
MSQGLGGRGLPAGDGCLRERTSWARFWLVLGAVGGRAAWTISRVLHVMGSGSSVSVGGLVLVDASLFVNITRAGLQNPGL